MKLLLHTIALLAMLAFSSTRADQASSANYSMAVSFEGGGQRVTSQNYEQNVVVTPIAGRVIATISDTMIIGFASRFNNAPIAANDVRSHPQDAAISFAAASLLANDFEPEGDPFSIIAVDATTQAGATVALDGQTVTYTPPAGLTTSDQFQYTIADANGDVAVATVTMLIAPPASGQPLNTVALIEQPDGKMLLRFRAEGGSTDYIIEFTHDLNNQSWQTLQDVHAGADGIVELLIDPALNKQTFFRAVVY
jgi:hypothetical protein